MIENYHGLPIPEEISNFIKGTIPEYDISVDSEVEVNRDSRGRIISVTYYSGDIAKQVFYEGQVFTRINKYHNKQLYSQEEFKDGKRVSKEVYNKDKSLAFRIDYEFDERNQIIGIYKKTPEHRMGVKYLYDTLDRIVGRNIYLDGQSVASQGYNYDVLNRVVEYTDNNQRIVVKSVSQKNELLSYVITDKMGNEISVKNRFTETGYSETEISLNGHSTTVRDTSYADNVMLKKPYTSEYDLDLIISNLFKPDKTTRRTEYNNILSNNSMGLIDSNIELRTLPISIRKRILYNIAVAAKS